MDWIPDKGLSGGCRSCPVLGDDLPKWRAAKVLQPFTARSLVSCRTVGSTRTAIPRTQK